MRIQGRLLRPSNLAERRVLKSLGVDTLRVRRGLNPFMVVRMLAKVAVGRGGDLPALRALLKKNDRPAPPVPALPDSTSAPALDEHAA
jgi:hypothetical protein